MRCPICKHETADNSNFCGYCGAKLIDYKKEKENSPVEQQNQPTVEQENTPVGEGNLFADPETHLNLSSTAQPNQTIQNYSNVPQSDYMFEFAPKKKSKTFYIAIIAAVLAITVAALYFLGVFNSGPLVEIAKAADKTAQSKNFHFTMEITVDKKTVKADGAFLFDPARQKIEFYLKVNNVEHHAFILLLKDNILLEDSEGFVDTTDLSDYLLKFWEGYSSNTEVEWSDYLEALGYGPSKVDYDKFDAAAETFILNLNDEDYINEKLGSYRKTKSIGTTNHIFEIKSRNLSKELVNVFGEAFRLKDEEEKTDAEGDIYNNLKEVFGTKFALEFSVKSGYLTGFSMDFANTSINAEFSDFGQAEIDESIIEKYKSYLASNN